MDSIRVATSPCLERDSANQPNEIYIKLGQSTKTNYLSWESS